MINNGVFKQGVKDSIPVCLSFFFIFASLGSICHTNNLTSLNSVFMTVGIFAAPVQGAILYSLQHKLDYIYVAFLAFIINFRFLLNSAVLAPYFKNTKLFHLFIMTLMFSASTFTVSYIKYKSDESITDHRLEYFYGVAIPSYTVAILATLFGYMFIKTIDNQIITAIFTIVLPLHFSALTAKRYPNIAAIFATLSGFIGMPFVLSFKSSFADIVFAIIMGVIISFIDYKKKGRLNE